MFTAPGDKRASAVDKPANMAPVINILETWDVNTPFSDDVAGTSVIAVSPTSCNSLC